MFQHKYGFQILHCCHLNKKISSQIRFRFLLLQLKLLNMNIHIGDADHLACLIETHSLSKAERLTLLKVVASVCEAVNQKKGFINLITSSVNA